MEIQARIDRLPAANCHLTAADCGVSEAEQAKNWGCIVCRQVSAWLDAGRQLVVMTLVQNNGVRIFPSDSAVDEPGLLLVLNRDRVSVDQMRLILLHVCEAVDKVWLWMDDIREFRVIK